MFSRLGGRGATSISALVNGAVGVVSLRDGGPAAVLGFTVTGSRITAIDILADPDRLATLDLAALA